MTTIVATIQLPWTKPPMSMNDRQHYMVRARLTKSIRTKARTLARASRLPVGLAHVDVALAYRPRDRRRRDTDNLMPVLKALCDGLVDYGLVPDDTPDFMTKHMPRLEEPQKGAGGAMWLEVTWEGMEVMNVRTRAAQDAGTDIELDAKGHE